jgi:pimeloyl-ACP methyl ester carboxylesterase
MKIHRGWLWSLGVVVALIVACGIAVWFRPIECALSLLHLRMAMTGIHGRSTTIDGMFIHYDVTGPADGSPVVLVHGLGGRAEDWVNLAPYLTRAGYRVYMPDLPGYGRSAEPANFSYSVPDEANVVVAFMDAMKLGQVDLGGWSMGGWIVQWIASQHPDRVKRLILFDAAGLSVKPEWNTGLFTPQDAAQVDQLDALLMPDPPKLPGFVAADILRISRNHAWVMHRALDSMLTGQFATDKLLPELKMPVLLVWGAEDRIIPLDLADTIHRLVPQSRLDVIPGCGHLAPRECAPQIGPGVVNFLAR